MTDSTRTPGDENAASSSTRWVLVVGLVVILAALGAALFLFGSDDDDDTDTSVAASPETTVVDETVPDTTAPETTTPETTEPETTAPDTTTPETTEPDTSEPPLPDDLRSALWPWVDTDLRFADPVEAATSFATDFLGFDDPIVGAFLAGDARSGEVEIRAGDPGPVTTVLVRQLGDDDTWWVLGSIAENIVIDEPEALEEITSPVTVAGSATAFEGTVEVELRADGNGEPIFEGFVTASGGPEPGPFSDVFEFVSPGETGGALVLRSSSSEDGSVLEASALRVFYR